MDIKALIAALKAQDFGPDDSQIASALMHPVEAINRGGEWLRHNASVAGGGDPYDNPNPIIGPTQDQQAEAGMNLAGIAQLGGMPGAPSSAGGTLGTFIGPKAASWDKQKAELAKQLLDSGAPPKQVWKDHLIGRLPGGHLFSEIDDSAAKFVNKPTTHVLSKNPKIHQLFNHDELLNNYPSTQYYSVKDSGSYGAGHFNYDESQIAIPASTPVKSTIIPQEAQNKINEGLDRSSKSVLLHELQHAIQDREGWPTGGSPTNTPLYDVEKLIEIQAHRKSLGIDPEQIRTAIDSGQQVPIALRERLNKYDDLLRQEKEILDNKLAPIEAYRRLTGEAQARLTQERIQMNMEQRRENYPLEGNKIADIPFNKLITRYGGSGDQRSIDLPETEFSIAHKIAQEHAALPIEQGGLGLPPDNTAMDRARALGFDTETPLYHGTNADIKEFDLNKTGSATGAIQYGDGIYTTTTPGVASGYANLGKEGANVMPLFSNAKNLLNSDSKKNLTKAQIKKFIMTSPDKDQGLSNYGDVNFEGFNKVLNDAVNSNYEYQDGSTLRSLFPIANDFYPNDPIAFNKAAQKITKHEGVNHQFSNGERFVIPWDAKNIRSKFAAFDPFKKDSANILASILLGTTLASQQENK